MEAEIKVKQLLNLAVLSIVLSYPALYGVRQIVTRYGLDLTGTRVLVIGYFVLVMGCIGFALSKRLRYYREFVRITTQKFPLVVWIFVDLTIVFGSVELVINFLSSFNSCVYSYFSGPEIFGIRWLIGLLSAYEFVIVFVPMVLIRTFAAICYLKDNLLSH